MEQFISDNKSVNTITSSKSGAFFIVISLLLKIQATIIGKMEFLAKLIFTSPLSLLPPSTIIFPYCPPQWIISMLWI